MAQLEEKQGFLGELNQKSKVELMDLLGRQEKLLNNKKFIKLLPDKGLKIYDLAADLRRLIAAREEVDVATDLMEELTLLDEEMQETESLHLEGKDVNVINREACVKHSHRNFCPHRTLRSNLGDLLEETVATDLCVQSDPKFPASSAKDYSKIVLAAEDHLAAVDKLTTEELRKYEFMCQNLQSEFIPQLHRLDQSVNYCLVFCCLLTNTTGENGEICRILAKYSDEKSFSEYCLPSYISTGINRHYGIKIEYSRSVRILTRSGEDTRAQPMQIVLKNFVRFLHDIGHKEIVLVTVGQSCTLLHNFRTQNLLPPNILFANFLKSGLKSLCAEKIISEQRVIDILRNYFEKYPLEMLSSCEIMDLPNAKIALKRSTAYTQRFNSFRGKLFDFSMKEKEVISQTLARRLAEMGLNYGDLDRLYRESELGLVAVLVKCVSVTRDAQVIAALLRYFRHKHGILRGFAEVLTEGATDTDRVSKLVPLDESLKLMYEQKERMKRIQIEQAKRRLTKNVNVKMSFDPEATKFSLKYRDVNNEDGDSDIDAQKDVDDDSEAEQDYPE